MNIKWVTIGLLAFTGLIVVSSCEEDSNYQDSGQPEARDFSFLDRISVGNKYWGKIPNSWNWGLDDCTLCTGHAAGSTVQVEDGLCSYTMTVDSCQCVGPNNPGGNPPGCYCYGTCSSIPASEQGDCAGANPPGWPPPHGGPL